MAYRRKQGALRATTYEDLCPPSVAAAPQEPESSPSSLAAQAIRASAVHRDSSVSSAYGESAYRHRTSPHPQEAVGYEYTSIKNLNESKYGFWGVLARKAKGILEDDNEAQQSGAYNSNRPHMLDKSTDGQYHQPYRSSESYRKTENPTFRKGSEAITSSLNVIGGTIRNALEEGLKNVENKTADIIQETRKLQIRRKGTGSSAQNQATDPIQIQTDQETQLKASRDVANAMAAKAKLLLRELKTVKADLAFAKERCRQLEDENKILRESRDKGDDAEDDDLIRLQLETLLAEKARLAHENSIYARENRFLREIVEYHQLTMQDVVYVDEGIEEVTEVYPYPLPSPSSYVKCEPPSAAASPSPSPSPSPRPSRMPPPAPLNSIVESEACPIVPTPPTPPSHITTGFACADTENIPFPLLVDGLNGQDSATDSV